jgi:tellurite resistance protein
MAEKEFLGDRRRKEEEEYFRRQEEQLIEKFRQRRAAEETRRGMAESTGVLDQQALRDLETLGYAPDTVMLLFLMPLVEVAWADGGISDRERALIIEAARTRGIEAGSAADQQLASWLEVAPSAEFYQKTLRVIGAILQGRSPQEREADRRDLLSYTLAVASASGGILGLGKVSNDEKQVLARLTRELERLHGPVAPPISTQDEGRP